MPPIRLNAWRSSPRNRPDLKVAHALAGAGIEPREARLLLAEACGFSEASVIAQGERELPPEIVARFMDMVARRCAGEPIA